MEGQTIKKNFFLMVTCKESEGIVISEKDKGRL